MIRSALNRRVTVLLTCGHSISAYDLPRHTHSDFLCREVMVRADGVIMHFEHCVCLSLSKLPLSVMEIVLSATLESPNSIRVSRLERGHKPENLVTQVNPL
jgi:hypothetical protein